MVILEITVEIFAINNPELANNIIVFASRNIPVRRSP